MEANLENAEWEGGGVNERTQKEMRRMKRKKRSE